MKTLGRILFSAIAGYGICVAAAALGTFVSGLVFAQTPGAMPTTAYLSVSVAVGFLGAVAGGYAGSRLAPEGKRLISLALLVLLYMGMAVAAVRFGHTDARQPFGFLPLVTLLGVVGAWAGAMTERAIYGQAISRESP